MIRDIEKILEQEKSPRNPFLVPEGYFDNLTGRVMDNIPMDVPSGKRKAQILHMRMMRWAAACVCFILISTSAYVYLNKHNESDSHLATTDDISETMMEAADYAMIDNQDMYKMLAEE